MCCVFILGTKLPLFYKQSFKLGLKKNIFCFQWFLLDPDPYSLIRIRILNPANTDPGKWYGFYGSGSATLQSVELTWPARHPCASPPWPSCFSSGSSCPHTWPLSEPASWENHIYHSWRPCGGSGYKLDPHPATLWIRNHTIKNRGKGLDWLKKILTILIQNFLLMPIFF